MDVLHWLLAFGCLALGALWWVESLHRKALEAVADARTESDANAAVERDAAMNVLAGTRAERDTARTSAAWWQARAESAAKELDDLRAVVGVATDRLRDAAKGE